MVRGGRSAAAAREAAEPAGQAMPQRAPSRGVWVDTGSRRFRARSSRLSGKERLVLAELARGNTTEEIGGILHVSPHTVRTHIKNAMRKLEARTRAHAVAIAMSEDAIELDPPGSG